MGPIEFKISGKTFPMPQTAAALEKVGKRWRKNARISLKKQDKVNTGTLYNSIPVKVFQNSGAFYVDITPTAHYWEFVDKGVRGATSNKWGAKQAQSPFKFGSGNGPKGLRGKIDKWVLQKGLSGTRDAQGRFISRKSLVYAISSAVYNRGLKPTEFLSGTGERIKKQLYKLVAPAFTKDVANALRIIISSNENTEIN